jgi:hypothetical protein
MTDEKKVAPKADEPKRDAALEELADDDLGKVVGGFNPQPDPPGRA